MKKWITIILLIAGAAGCYLIAGIKGIGLFLLLGLVFELLFWRTLFLKRK